MDKKNLAAIGVIAGAIAVAAGVEISDAEINGIVDGVAIAIGAVAGVFATLRAIWLRNGGGA